MPPMQQENAKPVSTLHKLPREIRDKVYELLIPTRVSHFDSADRREPDFLGLMLTNKTINDEFRQRMYETSAYHLVIDIDFHGHLKQRTPFPVPSNSGAVTLTNPDNEVILPDPHAVAVQGYRHIELYMPLPYPKCYDRRNREGSYYIVDAMDRVFDELLALMRCNTSCFGGLRELSLKLEECVEGGSGALQLDWQGALKRNDQAYSITQAPTTVDTEHLNPGDEISRMAERLWAYLADIEFRSKLEAKTTTIAVELDLSGEADGSEDDGDDEASEESSA